MSCSTVLFGNLFVSSQDLEVICGHLVDAKFRARGVDGYGCGEGTLHERPAIYAPEGPTPALGSLEFSRTSLVRLMTYLIYLRQTCPLCLGLM